jgi:hypothetical protein
MAKKGEVKVSADTKNLKRRLARILKRVDEEGKLSVEQIGRFGRDQIQRYMPKDTGASAESIGYTVLVNARGMHRVEIIQISIPHPDKVWDNDWFNLPLWMFTSDKAIAHYSKSNGSIMAMRGVVDTLRKEFRADVERRFKDPNTFK